MKHIWLLLVILTFPISLFPHSLTLAQDGSENDPLLVTTIPNVDESAKSPTEDIFAIRDLDGRLYLWDFETQHEIRTLTETIFAVRLKWSLNGLYLGALCGNSVCVWNIKTGSLVRFPSIHPIHLDEEITGITDWESFTYQINDFAISPDGIFVATSNRNDNGIALWAKRSTETVELVRTLVSDGLGVFEVDFSNDGSMLLSRQFHSVSLWDVQSGQLLLAKDTAWEEAALSPDGRILATGFGRLTSLIDLWDVQSGQLLGQFEAPLVVDRLEWTADSRTLFGRFTDWALVTEGFVYTGQALRAWDVVSGQEIATFEFTSEKLLPVALTPDETLIGVPYDDEFPYVLIWNQQTGDVYDSKFSPDAPLNSYQVTTDTIGLFALSPDQKRVITVTWAGIVSIWNFETGDFISNLSISPGSFVWLSDSATIAMLFEDGTLSFYQL